MGIPSYFSYIVKNHSNIIKKLSNNTIQVNNLYLDCNSIIYDAVHNIDFAKLVESDMNTIIRAVCVKIDEYISLLKPFSSFEQSTIIKSLLLVISDIVKFPNQHSRESSFLILSVGSCTYFVGLNVNRCFSM